jgi:tetratricopeptide (TPR) repeat protein
MSKDYIQKIQLIENYITTLKNMMSTNVHPSEILYEILKAGVEDEHIIGDIDDMSEQTNKIIIDFNNITFDAYLYIMNKHFVPAYKIIVDEYVFLDDEEKLEKIFYVLLGLTEKGDNNAAHRLGEFIFTWNYRYTKHLPRALKAIESTISPYDNGKAEKIFGLLILNGIGQEANEKKGFQHLEKAASKGNYDAMWQSGSDIWLRILAEKKHSGAMYRLGSSFYDKNDIENAIKWYKKAGENAHSLAYLELGLLYAIGKDVTQDKNEAKYYFDKMKKTNDDWKPVLKGKNIDLSEYGIVL